MQTFENPAGTINRGLVARGLVAVHNIRERSLDRLLDLEGIPMPSIAVTKAEIGHKKFGEISLVFRKETIDPRNRKNKVYSADVWSPTFPQMEYEADTGRANEIEHTVRMLVENLPERWKHQAVSFVCGLEYNLNDYGGMEGMIDRASTNTGLRAAFLASKGDLADPVYRMADGGEEIPDYDVMAGKMQKQLDMDEYYGWLNGLFDGLVKNSGLWNGKEPYYQDGTRKTFRQTHIPYNAKNIVKEMLAQADDVRNVFGFAGVKTIRAATAEEFKSLKAIAAASERIQNTISDDEYERRISALNGQLSTVLHRIATNTWNYGSGIYSRNIMADTDTVGTVLLESCDNPTAEHIKNVMGLYKIQCTQEDADALAAVVKEVLEMPVTMFEAKPQRVVAFDEIAAAIIPDSTSQRVRQKLETMGIRILVYPAENETERLRLLNSLKDVCFAADCKRHPDKEPDRAETPENEWDMEIA